MNIIFGIVGLIGAFAIGFCWCILMIMNAFNKILDEPRSKKHRRVYNSYTDESTKNNEE